MNRRTQAPLRRTQTPAFRQALERLDEALEQNTSVSHAERLQLIGRHIFGDLWQDPKQSGTEVIPK